MRCRLVEAYHWSFEYIDNLPLSDFGDLMSYLDGKNKAKED